jgi:hypothetical protein
MTLAEMLHEIESQYGAWKMAITRAGQLHSQHGLLTTSGWLEDFQGSREFPLYTAICTVRQHQPIAQFRSTWHGTFPCRQEAFPFPSRVAKSRPLG